MLWLCHADHFKSVWQGRKGIPAMNPFIKQEVQVYTPGNKASHIPTGLSGKQLQPAQSRLNAAGLQRMC